MGAEQGPRFLSSQPMELSLRIYERRAKHFEERRPCLQPGHGPPCAWGGGKGWARERARRPRDGWREERMQETRGQKSFWEQRRKLRRRSCFSQVCVHAQCLPHFPEVSRRGPSQPQKEREKTPLEAVSVLPLPQHQQLNNITEREMAALRIWLLLGRSQL